jgi:hypothetical protein
MTTNPYVNALAAVAYVALVVCLMFFGQRFIDPVDNVLMPMAMLSLLVLSVAFMATCFFYQPVQLFLSGDKARATELFVKTVVTFALITVLIFTTLLILSQLSGRLPNQTLDGPMVEAAALD